MAASQRNSKTTSAKNSTASQKQNSRTKKTNGVKRTAKNTSKGRTKKVSERNAKEKYSDAFMLICVTALMIFVAGCNIGLCGVVGKTVRSIFFGLFGIVQYVLPFLIIFAAFAIVAEQYSSYIIRKVTLSVVMVVLLCALAHMVVHIDWGLEQLGKSFVYSKENQSAGGVIGALIISIFYPLLDKSGTYLLIILAIAILFLLIAGDYVFDLIRNFSVYFKEDEEEMLARENYQARKEERMRMKQEMRKNARKQYYREATQKEDDALDKLRKKRMQRMHMNTENTMLTYQIAPKDTNAASPSKNTKKVLADEGFAISGETKQDKQQTAEHIAKTMKRAKEEEVQANVEISESGELKITGIYEDVIESEKREFADNIMQEEGFAEHSESTNTINATIVETTAHFVDEEDLDEIVPEAKEAKTRKESKRKTKQSMQETQIETSNTEKEIERAKENSDNSNYQKPLLELLARGNKSNGSSKAELQATAKKLEETLDSFGVHVTVTNVSCGPAVTRYEMLPEQGTRVSKITNLADDIKLNLAVADIRIEAPIPGKSAIGIEIPNRSASAVAFRDLLEESDFLTKESDLSFAAGKDISGQVVISDIAKMPHVLIAGATGSGKSVCINTLIMSLLYKAHPDDVKLIMIDPKVVELSVYNGIPHLLIPVVTDPKKASGALNWAVAEMKARYDKFAEYNVRNLEGYNSKVEKLTRDGDNPNGEIEKMPKIVIIVDELADLMMVAHGEVEDAIVRLSQLARAAGIHLVIATQRPSVDVITGLIKANVPSRIAFAVSSGVDSRTILDMNGAEKLLGKGDMLFAPSGYPKPIRVQGAFVSDKEVSKVVEFLKAQNLKVQYNDNITREINCGPQSVRDANKEQERDEYFVDAARFIIEKEKASIGMLQRVYKIGFNRAARIMDQLSEAGVVGPEEGTKPRQILMSMEELENMLEEGL